MKVKINTNNGKFGRLLNYSKIINEKVFLTKKFEK